MASQISCTSRSASGSTAGQAAEIEKNQTGKKNGLLFAIPGGVLRTSSATEDFSRDFEQAVFVTFPLSIY